MRLTVLKTTLLVTLLLAMMAGCGGGESPDVQDAVGDAISETIGQDVGDTVEPLDARDILDAGSDVHGRDVLDVTDEGGFEVTDDGQQDDVNPADVLDATDIGDTSDAADVTTDNGQVECINDQDCAGKITLKACQTAWCNDDNLCEAVNVDDDTGCVDNSICTTDEKCVAGECVGTPVNCDDNDECTTDYCSEANYCYHRPYYYACNDSNACTENDSCATGTCVGTYIACNDNNSCTTDSCDIDTGCVATKLSGMTCDDGDGCTKSDVCINGVCNGTFDCDDGNACTLDGCNELGCTHEPMNGDICDDGLVCTVDDTCVAGTCNGTRRECDDGIVCTEDYCLEGTGCKTRFNTVNCDDGNGCTRNDRCQYGLCKGTSYSCPTLTCMDANNCDGNGGCQPVYSAYGTSCASDDKQCTDDICSSGSCIHPNSASGTTCNDSDLCTQTDECSNGVCVGKNPVACSVADACKDPGTCDPATGTCTLGVLPEGSTCTDGLMCTKNDKCTAGSCQGTPVTCVAINNCHETGVCNPTDGTCNEVFKPNGTTCSDSNLCTQTDTCLEGYCSGGNPVTCTALDACHVAGTCNVGTGVCSNPQAPNATLCNDQNPCTRLDSCTNGFCSGTAYSCNDNLSCTTETCDGNGGCDYDVIDNWCRISGACVLPTSVKPGNMCQVCDPTRNQDDWSPVTGGVCDDLDTCTINDTCSDGTCTGTVYSCDDGIACTVDSCDGLGGCLNSIAAGWCLIDGECYFNNQQDPDLPCRTCNTAYSQTQFTPRAEGESCDDGVACTHSDKCTANLCAGTTYACNDGIDCTTDSCKGDGDCLFVAIPGYCFIEGACVAANTVQPGNACAACIPAISNQFWSGYREGESCDDGSLCTDVDKCASGVCSGNPRCDDALDCTDDYCDPSTGGCTNTIHENYCAIDDGCYYFGDQKGMNQCLRCIPTTGTRSWTATTGYGCDDSNACTVNDTCDGETCTGTPMTCDDGLACTTDFCEYGRCGTVPVEGWCIIDGQCITSGTSPIDDPCLICDPTSNPYDWTYTYLTACDDSDGCTYGDVCMAGMCLGQAYDCSDGVYCTTDFCDGNGGCDYTVVDNMCLISSGCYANGDMSLENGCDYCNPLVSQYEWSPNNGISCDDGQDCTSSDECTDSVCAGTLYNCDDGLVCTADFCDGDGTCTHEQTAGWCLIDNVCYRDQTLEPGNSCRACLSSTSNTGWSANNGLACDDGQDCTKVDTCTNGACVGTTYACDDGRNCTADTCDGVGGCISTLLDGYCMINYACFANKAVNPDNICEKCLSAQSTGSWSFNNGSTCTDFDSCTINDSCLDGACAGTAYSCDDGIECTLDMCDGGGNCANPLSPDACMIGGTCYDRGDLRPGVPCEACAPDDSQSVWTELNPNAIEICNGVDDNCDGLTDYEGVPGCANYYFDGDRDGVGVLSNFKCLCAPTEDYRTTVYGDCNDNEPFMYEGRAEACDGLDNDCDGITDPDNTFGCQVFFFDNDGDTWGVESGARCLCSSTGKYTSMNAGDCNDNNVAINPASDEICNSIDDNCDGRTDPVNTIGCVTRYVDSDHDGWGDDTISACICSATQEYSTTVPGDCNDFDAAANPSKVEICNNKDDDCSGLPDDQPLEVLCPHDPASIQNGTIYCDETCKLQCTGENAPAGTPAWYNQDGSYANGCECQGDQMELSSEVSAADPYAVASMGEGGVVVTAKGKLTSPPNEDWLLVTAIDNDWAAEPDACDDFNMVIKFSSNPNSEFEMDFYRQYTSGTGQYTELLCSGMYEWNFATNFDDGTRGECPCDSHVCAALPDDSEFIVECKRVNGNDWVTKCNSCGEHDPGMNVCTNNTQTVLVKVHRKDGAPVTCSEYELEVSNGYYQYVAP